MRLHFLTILTLITHLGDKLTTLQDIPQRHCFYIVHLLKLSLVNRNHLALFHAVAQAGGISRGAEQAHVSQPAVSKQIKELEDALGVTLLERLPRGSRLTEAGRILADYAQRVATLEQDASRAIEEFRGLKRGHLSIGASTTIGAYLLPPVFGHFHKRYPNIEMRLEIANTREIQRFLMEGTIEVGLTEGLIEAEHLDSEVFHQDELVAIAPPHHPLLKKGRVTARMLCHEPFILREEGSGTRAVVERALETRGLSVKPVLSLAGTEVIKRAVIAGLGIAIVSKLAIGLELKFGSLAVIPVKDLVIRRPLHLQWLRGRAQSPPLQQFLLTLASTNDTRCAIPFGQ
jgi:molybdate transport repressor ModE-like protein